MIWRVALLCAVIAGAFAAPASADVVWLCHPAAASNPCAGDQTTTYYAGDGSSRVVTPPVPADPAVDCFYVYPTVSNQPTPNARQTADPEQKSIAEFQAQRFSTRCRVFAPVYRQVTAAGLTLAGQTHDTSGYDIAYADVREAWLRYLAQDNGGRPFILIGHSQGSRLLRALIRREIDGNADLRARMVSAIMPGANVAVPPGQVAGGDFANVPLCQAGAQTGCVLAWSTFNEDPPANARYGRSDTDPIGGALGLPNGPQYEVACTDPVALSGSAGAMQTLLPSKPFAPGVIALLLLRMYGGPPPSAPTPWLSPKDHYTARCVFANGAHVLMMAPVGNARKLTPSPDATWGIHLADVNLVLDNLLTIVDAQTAAWVAAA